MKDARVIAYEKRYGKKQKVFYGVVLTFFTALFSALAAWQFSSRGVWGAGALAAAIVQALTAIFFFAQCAWDKKREKTPVLRLSQSELFLYKNGWTCLPLTLIEEIDVKKRGSGERVIIKIQNDVYETKNVECARAAAEEIAAAAEKARRAQSDFSRI